MKINSLKHSILLVIALVLILPVNGAEFKADEEITISRNVDDNLYIGATTITVDHKIMGDLTAAGSKITINDSIFGDLLVAGSDLVCNGVIMDDAKFMGSNITIFKNVHGDLIVMGGFIEISKEVTVERDLIVMGGNVTVNGNVNGNLIVKGGNVTLYGIVAGETDVQCDRVTFHGEINGPSKLAAMEIEFGENARFRSDVRYWTEDGQVDFDPYLSGATATYDESLELEPDMDWRKFGMGFAGFWLIFTLSIFLIILLLQLLCRKAFHDAAQSIEGGYFRNFGIGVLYFIGLPLLALLFFISVIGIPIGILLITIFGLSLMFAFSVTSVMMANWINVRFDRNWGNWMIMLIAALIFLAMKLIFILPPLGLLVSMILVAMTFGTIVNAMITKIRS